MNITVDCRMIKSSGVGVYLRGCLDYLLQSENQFLLLGDPGELSAYKTKISNARILKYTIKPFSPHELIPLPAIIKKEINTTDCFFTPFFNIPAGITIPVYATIHDMIFPDMPNLTSRAGLAARMFFYKRCFKKAKKIFTVSEFSKSRINHYSGNKKPVIVTYVGVQPCFLSYYKINKKKETVVFIGNIKKHKGLDVLLDAFTLARENGLCHKLIIIGEKDKFRTKDNSILKKIDSFEPDAVTFTGFVSNEQLMEYVSSAALLIQPSLYEGFCLPPLEAMVLGTPALISDIPVLKEIYAGFPVTFFKAADIIDLKEKMVSLLSKKKSFPMLPDYLSLKYTFDKTVSIILKEMAN